VAFDDRAGKLHSDNVRLIAGMKGEVPNTTLAILITKPKQQLQTWKLTHMIGQVWDN